MRLASSSHPSHARIFALAILIAIAALFIAAGPVHAQEDCSWLDEFEVAYERGDATAYGALLAPEFRFYFGDEENRRQRPQGWDKNEELASYTNLHRGVVRADGTSLRALEIDVQFAGVRMGGDPDVPGSADHLLVFVRAATLFIRFEDGRRAVDTAPHAFHLVRGKAIGKAGAAAEEWFARSWIERPTEAPQLLAALDAAEARASAAAAEAGAGSDAGGDASNGGEGAATVALAGVQAALPRKGVLWPNPVQAGRTVSLAFDLAAAGLIGLEVFDVRGLSIAAIAAQKAAPGRRTLAWDCRVRDGAVAPAGVYFVRAHLGDRDARHRVIVLR